MFQIGYLCLPSAVISNTAQVCEESFCCLKPWTSSRQNVKKLVLKLEKAQISKMVKYVQVILLQIYINILIKLKNKISQHEISKYFINFSTGEQSSIFSSHYRITTNTYQIQYIRIFCANEMSLHMSQFALRLLRNRTF